MPAYAVGEGNVFEEGPGRDRKVVRGQGAWNWLNQLPAAAAILRSSGHVEQFNDQAAALFGWSGGATVRFTDPDAAWLRKLIQESVAGTDVVTVITRRGRNGRIAVEVRCRRIDVDQLLVFFRDCTSQVAAKKSRRSGEHHLRRFLGRLPEPVLIEQNGRIMYYNPAAVRLVGASVGELFGVSTAEILPDAILQGIRADARRESGEATPVEVALELGDGRRLLQVAALPVRYQSSNALVLILRDITDQRRTERGLVASRESLRRSEEQLRQSQKMDAIGRMAAGIAHDFNNLLTAIQGHLQFVLEDLPHDAVVRDDVLEVRRVADRATELTRQLLTFARRQPYRPQAVAVNEVVRNVERLLRRLVTTEIDLSLILDDDVPLALADRGQLEQVLVNLTVNARDAMADGGTITIRTSSSQVDSSYAAPGLDLTPGNFVQLAISDSGCGMSPEVQSRMFEPFFTTKTEGTGLGLPTVYGIVKQSGGHISVYSEEGLGTTVKIFLRSASDSDIEVLVEPSNTLLEPTAVRDDAATVLLVEDDHNIRNLAERTLRANGLHVIVASSVDDALRIAESGQAFDVLVTDLLMPHMTGDELAARISDRKPNTRVVIMSGFSEDILTEARVEQYEYFIEKPFTQQQFLETVREALRARSLSDSP
jgi:two-component system, cell cycle sensor histidine kinase and response regulator CckA